MTNIKTTYSNLNQKNKEFIIYKATNIINNKTYIGKTTTGLESRARRHIGNSLDRKQMFPRAIQKHGANNFKWEVIDNDAKSNDQLNNLEIWYIAQLKPEYNMSSGGDGGKGLKHTDESKELMRIKALQRPPFSSEHRRNIGLVQINKKASNETRLKMSKSHKGRVKSAEECANISKGKKGKKIGPSSETAKINLSIAMKLAYERKKERNRIKNENNLC